MGRNEHPRKSQVWVFFQIIDDTFARCTICNAKKSYKSTTSNLKKHMERKHPTVDFNLNNSNKTTTTDHPSTTDIDQNQMEGQEEITVEIGQNVLKRKNTEEENESLLGDSTVPCSKRQKIIRKKSEVWNFFDIIDDIFAECRICHNKKSYKSTLSNLKKHIERKHPSEEVIRNLSNERNSDITGEENEFLPGGKDSTKKSKRKSQVWNFFEVIDGTFAQCVICNDVKSYKSSITNLKKHIRNKHRDIDIGSGSLLTKNTTDEEIEELQEFLVLPRICSTRSLSGESKISPHRIEKNMGIADLEFSKQLTPSDPQDTPVLIIGQKHALASISFSDVKMKLEPRVSEEIFKASVEKLKPTTSDACSMYMNQATIACLPKGCSRHNTPSQAHSVTKLVKTYYTGNYECIVVVCEYRDVFASACAVARAFPLYSRKSKCIGNYTVTVDFIIVDGQGNQTVSLSDSDIECITAAAQSVRLTAKIVDMPCSEMNTDSFLEEIARVGEDLGIRPKVIRGEDLLKKGLQAIYTVGKAAIHPPALAVLSHIVPDATETIAWVGKGIVYDTGGLSIKSKTGMPGMKRDCGGAAAILGAFHAAVKLGFHENLHAIFCLAENSVGPKSVRPDDIITMYSGRTVEINNTDAEGRLVLGDGVSFADKDLNATTILDMATLTGCQGTTTGKIHAALLTNSEEWEKAAVKAGQTSGDLLHPLPYCPEVHFSEYNSSVADMKNSVSDRSNAQSSCGGLFIGAQIGFDYDGYWLHVDMSSPSYYGERATGYGVALLMTLFGHSSNNSLLQYLAPYTDVEENGMESASKKIRLEKTFSKQ